jgi:hypothetical protein
MSQRELNEAASSLVTAIEKRISADPSKASTFAPPGLELEQQLKRFAAVILKMAKEQEGPARVG